MITDKSDVSMTDIEEAKRKMEKIIIDSIKDFELNTYCRVNSVTIDRICTHGAGSNIVGLKCEVNL